MKKFRNIKKIMTGAAGIASIAGVVGGATISLNSTNTSSEKTNVNVTSNRGGYSFDKEGLLNLDPNMLNTEQRGFTNKWTMGALGSDSLGAYLDRNVKVNMLKKGNENMGEIEIKDTSIINEFPGSIGYETSVTSTETGMINLQTPIDFNDIQEMSFQSVWSVRKHNNQIAFTDGATIGGLFGPSLVTKLTNAMVKSHDVDLNTQKLSLNFVSFVVRTTYTMALTLGFYNLQMVNTLDIVNLGLTVS